MKAGIFSLMTLSFLSLGCSNKSEVAEAPSTTTPSAQAELKEVLKSVDSMEIGLAKGMTPSVRSVQSGF